MATVFPADEAKEWLGAEAEGEPPVALTQHAQDILRGGFAASVMFKEASCDEREV